MSNKLTYKRAHELFSYCAETGILTRKIKTSNRVKIGDTIDSIGLDGYVKLHADWREYRAHRVIFLMMTGRWPDNIDHRNMIKSDNRWANLREATKSQNGANTRKHKRNKSGLKGVTWSAHAAKWRAVMMIRGKLLHLGYFDCPAAAHFAYVVAADKHFGEFARSK